MGKKRLLDSKIRKSQSFAALTYRQRDLWQGIITMADDQGRLPGAPAFIRSSIWPYDDITLKEVSDDLQAIADCGYITIYEVDGGEYVQVVKWWCYQNLQWASPSDLPAPPGWVDRTRCHVAGNKIATENWDSNGGYTQLPSDVPSQLPSGIESGSVNVNGSGSGSENLTPYPSTPKEAGQHPDIQLYREITNITPGSSNWRPVIDLIRHFRNTHKTDEATITYLSPFWLRWTNSRTKDGKPYKKTSIAWLSDWALSGVLESAGSNGGSPYRAVTEEDMI